MNKAAKKAIKLFYNDGSVGWGLWALLWALFMWPGASLFLYATHDTIPYAARIASGMLMAGLVAAVCTWVINDVLFRMVVKPKFHSLEAEKRMEKEKEKKKRH